MTALAIPVVVTTAFGGAPSGIYLTGIAVGSLYALIAMGLILVYRASRVINFSQAALGAAPAVAALLLMSRQGLPYLPAVGIVIVGSLLLGGLVEVVVIRRFASSPRLLLTVATIGVTQLLAFLEFQTNRWIPTREGRNTLLFSVRSPFTRYEHTFGGARLTGDHLVTVLAVALLAACLHLFLRRTTTGRSVRAAAENTERAALMGIPVRRVGTLVWMLAALMSAVGVFQRTVVLGALPVGLAGTTTLLYGLAPAVIGRMQNIGVAFGAGIALGVIDQTIFYATRNATLSSVFILPAILIALLLQRSTLARSEDTGVSSWQDVKEFRPIPRELDGIREVRIAHWLFRVAVLLLVLAAPRLAGLGRIDVASLLVVYAIVGVSLVVLTGWSGQISLGQFALAGAGAAVAGGLAANHGVDFVATLVLAAIAGALLSVAIGAPALRVPGLFLAVTTLAFAVNVRYFFLSPRYFDWLLPDEAATVTRPLLFGRLDVGSDLAFYYVCVVVLAIAVYCARGMRSHRSGRVLIAGRDNRRAAQSYGISLIRTRLTAFAIAGALAGIAGALMAFLQGVVDAAVFTPERSLEIFAMCVIGGLTSVGGAIAGALYVVGFQYFLPDYSLLASGAGLLTLLMFFPGGLSEVGYRLRDSFLRAVAARRDIHVPSLVADSSTPDSAEDNAVVRATEGVESELAAQPTVAGS